MDWLDLLEVQGALIFYCNFKSKLKIFLVSSILWTKQLEPGNVFFLIEVLLLSWRRAWQATPVFLPGESPWTEETVKLQPMG